jgi:hypothetical protein
MSAMPNVPEPYDPMRDTRAFAGTCVRTALWYLLAVWVLWQVGYESIYGHPTPFHGLPFPVFTHPGGLLAVGALAALSYGAARRAWGARGAGDVRAAWVAAGVLAALLALWLARGGSVSDTWRETRYHLPVLLAGTGGLFGLAHALRALRWHKGVPVTEKRAWQAVAAIAGCAFVLACAVAMVRGGTAGIADAYLRPTYEYIGDIGIGGSIRGLFRDYNRMHPHLSMHGKVHPPGPTALLWMLSWVAGRSALGLSLATALFGCLALFPLYAWARDLSDRRAALTVCLFYALVPSITLFTATSADVLFMPFTLGTLFLFWRALHAADWRRGMGYAAAAGAGYAAMSLLSFSLIGVGAFLGIVGLWRMADPGRRLAVVRTAAVMLAVFLLCHGAVWLWSGFDVVACFKLCHAQFTEDQQALDLHAPRSPSWMFKLLNPATWFWFAGIPVSLLFLRSLGKEGGASRALYWVFAATLLALNFLYLARGEGERSALYLFPFLVIPAGVLLDRWCGEARSGTPAVVVAGLLLAQTWLTESLLYLYW